MTYPQARERLFAYLRNLGWTVKPGLKVPQAITPSGNVVYFKAQAVYLNQHSLWIDIREVSPSQFVEAVVARESSRDPGRRRTGRDYESGLHIEHGPHTGGTYDVVHGHMVVGRFETKHEAATVLSKMRVRLARLKQAARRKATLGRDPSKARAKAYARRYRRGVKRASYDTGLVGTKLWPGGPVRETAEGGWIDTYHALRPYVGKLRQKTSSRKGRPMSVGRGGSRDPGRKTKSAARGQKASEYVSRGRAAEDAGMFSSASVWYGKAAAHYAKAYGPHHLRARLWAKRAKDVKKPAGKRQMGTTYRGERKAWHRDPSKRRIVHGRASRQETTSHHASASKREDKTEYILHWYSRENIGAPTRYESRWFGPSNFQRAKREAEESCDRSESKRFIRLERLTDRDPTRRQSGKQMLRRLKKVRFRGLSKIHAESRKRFRVFIEGASGKVAYHWVATRAEAWDLVHSARERGYEAGMQTMFEPGGRRP